MSDPLPAGIGLFNKCRLCDVPERKVSVSESSIGSFSKLFLVHNLSCKINSIEIQICKLIFTWVVVNQTTRHQLWVHTYRLVTIFPQGSLSKRNASARKNHPTRERRDDSPRRVSPFSRGWFSRALVFRSLYYPWGKMRTTRRLTYICRRRLTSRGMPWDKNQPN